jgi:hypothetical protein
MEGSAYPMEAGGPAQAMPLQAQMAQALVPQSKPVTHDVTIVTTRKLAQAKVMGVPPEEFGIERGARTIRDCNYCFHEVVTKTEAQLIAEGFDEDDIKALTEYTGMVEIETLTRDTENEHAGFRSDINVAARLVKITEHYVRMDYEGNGRPCLYQVITGGDQGKVLNKDGKPSINPFDAIPFAATCPVPITHRFFGRSIADIVMPVQREKTALKRGMLDNLYLHNNPRVEVAEQNAGPNTLDDLLVSRPGGVVRTKTPGGLNWQVVPDITGSIFPALQYLDGELETKTGVTKQGQGIDANALQNQSATAVAQVFSSSQMRTKLIARIIAEGVRDIFALLHGTIRKHGQQAQTVKLRNSWTQVNPREWKTRDDMTINVGLGSGGRAQQFAQAMALAGIQEKLIAGGKTNIVDDDKVYHLAAEITKIMGHKNPDKFFNDPQAKDPQTGQLLHPPVPPPPDPKVMQIQAQAQNDQMEIKLKAQLDQQKAADAKALAEAKADLEAKMAVLEAHVKMVQEEQKARNSQQQHKAKVAETVVDVIATAHKHDMEIAHEQQAHAAKMEQADAAHKAKLEQMKNAPKPKGGEK